MNERFLYKLNSIIITLLFCAALFIPFSMGIIEKDKDISNIEKRSLAKYPQIPQNREDIKNFPKLFDSYYSDHFGLRDWFTEYYKSVKYIMGDSPSQHVTIGKDGWLFLGSIKKGYTGYSDPMGDARNINLYSQQDLKRFAEYMSGLKSWLNEKSIEYIFVIAPNKHSIYFDKLPDYIAKVNEHSATDQLVEYLQLYTNIPVVDLRTVLINNKDKHQLYYKTDTHWNHYAANIAQYRIMLALEKLFPEQIQAEKINIKDEVKYSGDLANFIGFHTLTELDPQPVFEKTCTPDKYVINIKEIEEEVKVGIEIEKEVETYTSICKTQKLNTVIFRDSFFLMLEPYFTRKFNHATFLKGRINYSSLKKYIELEKPDVVIEQWAERKLPHVPKLIPEFNISLYQQRFNNSHEIIFSNDFKNLKLNEHLNRIDSNNNFIHLKTSGYDPQIIFPLLPFKANQSYIVHIKIHSSVKSTLQLFYSDNNISEHPFSESPFSEEKSTYMETKKGDNELYFYLDHANIGQYLRLDPISEQGEVIIKSLEIKAVENM